MSSTKNKTKKTEEDEVEPWKSSQAKEKLVDDIISGKVTIGMDPREIYNMHEEYKKYEFKNFRTNVKNLENMILKLYNDADTALDGYENFLLDCEENPPPPLPPARNYPKWADSKAESLLKADMDHGLHEMFAPLLLWESRDEYQLFPEDVFRSHIYQEQRNRTARAYWKYNEHLGILGNKKKKSKK